MSHFSYVHIEHLTEILGDADWSILPVESRVLWILVEVDSINNVGLFSSPLRHDALSGELDLDSLLPLVFITVFIFEFNH